jgi:hypothetical protein
MTTMLTDAIQAAIRHLLTFLGGIGAALGWFDSADWAEFATAVSTLLGAAAAAVGLGWSLLQKWRAKAAV